MRLGVSAISPFGPIFGKELRVTARRKRSYFLRFFYLAFLLLFLVMVWSLSYSYSAGGGAAYRQQRQAEMGQAFFATFAIFCVAAMGLIGPVLTATAVSSERLHRTLGVLLMTPINAWQIVSGKLFSRMLVAVTLIGLSLPVLALVRLLGGVEISQMLGATSLCAITALIGASIGLFFSTLMRRGYAVILLSYVVMGFLYLFLPMVLVLADLAAPRQWVESFMIVSNPFVCTASLIDGPWRQGNLWIWCVTAHLALSAALLIAAAAALRRIARRESEGAAIDCGLRIADCGLESTTSNSQHATSKQPPLPTAPPTAPSDAPPPAIDNPQSAIRNPPSVSDNPVLWRELRRPLMARGWQRAVGSIITVGLLLATYGMLASENGLDEEETQIGYAWIFNALMMLLTCVISATAIAQEKETDTWTLLLTTPMTPRQIILGKVLGVTRKLLWPMLLIVGHFLLFAFAGVISWTSLALVLWVIITFNALFLASGILFSLLIRKVTFAVVLNLMLPIFIYAVMPILLLIVGELVMRGGEDLAELTLLYLPYYYLGYALDDLGSQTVWTPIMHQMEARDFLILALVAGCLHLLFAGFILQRLIANFDRICGRAASKNFQPGEPFVALEHRE